MAEKSEQSEQDALAAEWGLALDADAASQSAAVPAPGAAAANGAADQAAAQWSAAVGDGAKFLQGDGKGATERVLT